MDQPYSFWADLLSKFQSSPEWIKALWLIAPMLTVLGLAYLAAQLLREVLCLQSTESPQPDNGHGTPEGQLLYGIYKNARGDMILYRHGNVESLTADDLPPRLKMLQ